jgi:hypothetical protein
VQPPLQRAVELDAMADEAFAVIDEQPQVELGPIQVRGRKALQPLLHGGAGDTERVDRIGLAALTGAPAGLPGQLRRDPQHPLAARDHKPLQRPGHVTAVLKRPDPLALQAARPPQQPRKAAAPDRDRLLAEQLAGPRGDRRHRVRTLVSVREALVDVPRDVPNAG